ncbi:MAG TPA: Spy/CpxP family protein refolding chaperone [Gammaproteobacteria bacterium]|nr:Spy/CpxP family protein refolding chaperone [Gammaproteobacteria bacterium]
MKKRNAIIGSVLAATVLAGTAAGTASAFPGGHCDHGGHRHGAMTFKGGPMGGSGHHLMRLMEKLNLSKDQRDQIWKIVDAQRGQGREKMLALMENRKALRAATRGSQYDAGKVRELADRQGKLMADLMVMRADTKHRIRAVLTPEQQSQLDQMRGHHHRGGWGGRR